jgi:hypothetical protein
MALFGQQIRDFAWFYAQQLSLFAGSSVSLGRQGL